MDKPLFRQSALVVSTVISALFAVIYMYPFYPVLGTRMPAMEFMHILAVVWVLMALQRLFTGWWPALTKSLKWDVAIYSAVFAGWFALRFLMGWQALEGGYGIEAGPLTLAVRYLLAAAAAYALIAISARAELSGIFDRRWVKWTCVALCVASFVYCFAIKTGFHHHLVVSGVNIGWERQIYYCPLVWYIVVCIFRFLRKLFSKDFGWREVFMADFLR